MLACVCSKDMHSDLLQDWDRHVFVSPYEFDNAFVYVYVVLSLLKKKNNNNDNNKYHE